MPFTVAIAEVKQETNTSAAPTTLKDFEDFHLFYVDQIKTGLEPKISQKSKNLMGF